MSVLLVHPGTGTILDPTDDVHVVTVSPATDIDPDDDTAILALVGTAASMPLTALLDGPAGRW